MNDPRWKRKEANSRARVSALKKDKGKRIKDKLWRDKDVLKDEGKRMKDS
jgi:hypothetical protein